MCNKCIFAIFKKHSTYFFKLIIFSGLRVETLHLWQPYTMPKNVRNQSFAVLRLQRARTSKNLAVKLFWVA